MAYVDVYFDVDVDVDSMPCNVKKSTITWTCSGQKKTDKQMDGQTNYCKT